MPKITVKNLFAAYVVYKGLKTAAEYAKLNSLILPGGNMGISRSQMPQIPGQYMNEYIAHLKRNGIALQDKMVKTSSIRLTQNEYNKEKVLSLMDKLKKIGNPANQPPIIVSIDGFVLDGSHRFIANHNLNPNGDIRVLMASVKIKELLEVSRNFPAAQFRSVSDKKIAA
jgi:hypothetical protein